MVRTILTYPFVLDGTWTDELCCEFIELSHCAQWKPIMCKVISRNEAKDNDTYVVQLVDTSNQEVMKFFGPGGSYVTSSVCESHRLY